jgi:hypothetical protein
LEKGSGDGHVYKYVELVSEMNSMSAAELTLRLRTLAFFAARSGADRSPLGVRARSVRHGECVHHIYVPSLELFLSVYMRLTSSSGA